MQTRQGTAKTEDDSLARAIAKLKGIPEDGWLNEFRRRIIGKGYRRCRVGTWLMWQLLQVLDQKERIIVTSAATHNWMIDGVEIVPDKSLTTTAMHFE